MKINTVRQNPAIEVGKPANAICAAFERFAGEATGDQKGDHIFHSLVKPAGSGVRVN